MKIHIPAGTYVVAVSGGVDSMVLLHVLQNMTDLRLIVAHYDHGIRHDSVLDRKLVQYAAKQSNLPFVYEEGRLGPGASEETARTARYAFLHSVRRAAGAKAILTAHHQDDVLETAIMNILRGSNRRGLSSLQDRPTVRRPLLNVDKTAIRTYAREHGLRWNEDTTNADMKYRRNYVRHTVVAGMDESSRRKLLKLLAHVRTVNAELESGLHNYVHLQSTSGRLDRKRFILLPHAVAREIMAAWLRGYNLAGYDRKTLERLVAAAKTARPGKLADIQNGAKLYIDQQYLALRLDDR